MEEEAGYTVIREGILSVREFHFSLEDWRISRDAMLCEKAKGKGHFTKEDVMKMKEKLEEEKKNLDADDEVKSSDKKQKKIAKKLEDERKQLIKYQIETTKRYINMVETKYKEEQKRLRVEWTKILKENKQEEKEVKKRQRKMRKGKGKQNKNNKKDEPNVEAEKNSEVEKSLNKMDTACTMIDPIGTTINCLEKTRQCTVTGAKGDVNTADGCKDDQKNLKSGRNTDACETTGCGDESGIFYCTSNVYYISDESNHGNNESPDVVKLDNNYGNADKSVNESSCVSGAKLNGDDTSCNHSPVVPSVDVEKSLSTTDVEHCLSTADVEHSLSTTDIDIDVDCSTIQGAGFKTGVNGAVPSDEDRAVTKNDTQNLKVKDKKEKKKSQGCLSGLFSRLFSRSKSRKH